MTDRTPVHIYIPIETHKEREILVNAIMEDNNFDIQIQDTIEGQFSLFYDPEADGGGNHTIGQLVDRKIPFIGYHAAGDTYAACLFVYDGLYGKSEIPTDINGNLFIRVDVFCGTVKVDVEDFDDIKRFVGMVRKFNNMFGNPEPDMFGIFLDD